MAVPLASKLARLETRLRARSHTDESTLARLRSDSAVVMAGGGITPDPWQAGLLKSAADRILLLCSRQAGKSSTAAGLTIRTALLEPNSPVLLLSPSLRQSGELFRKVLDLYTALGRPVPPVRESA